MKSPYTYLYLYKLHGFAQEPGSKYIPQQSCTMINNDKLIKQPNLYAIDSSCPFDEREK
mgnify:CR=1 FL=1